MDLVIREEPIARLDEHASISIAFAVDRALEVVVRDRGLGGFELCEHSLAAPNVKDYDAIEGGHPESWGREFDVSNWGLLSAHVDRRRVGGAVIAMKTQGLHMLEGRDDLAVLWDIRIAPELRGRGIGSALFAAAEEWARSRGCRVLKVETQNVNVAACRFYASRGCELGAVHRFAYPKMPHEVQLLWYKDLSRFGR
jgi:GNAT superfamily N-acetyltransferase